MAVLFLFMVLADVLIAAHQRDFLYSAVRNQAKRDLQLIATYCRDPLLEDNYPWMGRFLRQWGEEHPEVTRLVAILPSGEELFSFSRPHPEAALFFVEQDVRHGGEFLISLRMEVAPAVETGMLRKLHWQLGLASFMLTVIAGLVAWLTLKRVALAPLEQEIALRRRTERELEEAQSQLEGRVRERTESLSQANSQLMLEMAERQGAEERVASLHRQYDQILNSAGEGIYGIDTIGRITFVNNAACQILGFAREEMVGRQLHEFRHHVRWDGSSYEAGGCPVCRAYVEGGKRQGGEYYFGRRDGSVFPAGFVSTPIMESGRPVGTVVVFEDITARKQAEHDLLALTETLEQRVMERTARLDAANLELRETLGQLEQTQEQLVSAAKMAALGDLVAGVAHEINTPVGVGVTAASHLEKETSELAGRYHRGEMKRSDLDRYLAGAQEAARLILANLNRAADLIRSFKQVAIDQSGEVRRRFHVRHYLEEVCLSLRPVLKKTSHRVEIDCDEQLELNSYPGAISQIVTNFITNSINHAYAEGVAGVLRIEVSHQGEVIRFRYRDDGRGMDEAVVGQVFEPFFTTNREKGGSGLGMHVVYNLVTQKLMGTIRCESRPGQGTLFEILFPAVIPGGGER
ncbi:MAG: PAS domain-containing sensor histidine kinase [Thermodesulfobacteriota bacterium]